MRLAVPTAFAFVLLCGLLHGLWTDRWERSPALETALARVELVPLQVGNWRGTPQEADPEMYARAGAQARWVRRYTHAHKKTSATVILMCGRAGRMAVHTPEVCYRGAGYEIDDAPVLFNAGGTPANQLWTARFTKATMQTADLRLYWGWNAHGVWEAPTSPRWRFRGQPFLYKLYVIEETVPGRSASDAAADTLAEFLPQLLGALEDCLFPEKRSLN